MERLLQIDRKGRLSSLVSLMGIFSIPLRARLGGSLHRLDCSFLIGSVWFACKGLSTEPARHGKLDL